MSKPAAIFRPLWLAVVLAIGFGLVFGMIVAWSYSVWEGLRSENRGYQSESLLVRSDGTPLIRRDASAGYRQTTTYRTLDGVELDRSQANEMRVLLSPAGLPVPRERPFMFPLNGWARTERFSDEQEEPTHWYFMHDGQRDGHAYFVGYDYRSKLCVGFLGRHGNRPDRPPVEDCFPVDGVRMAAGAAFSQRSMVFGGVWYGHSISGNTDLDPWKVHLIPDGQLVEIDLRKRTATALMESADLVSLGALTPAAPEAAQAATPSGRRHAELALRTSKEVLIFDPAGKRLRPYSIPEDLRRSDVVFYELRGETALVTTSRSLRDHSSREELYWIDRAGKVLRHTELVLAGYTSRRYDERTEAWQSTAVAPCPIVLAFLATVPGPIQHLDAGAEPGYARALARSWSVRWPSVLVVSLLSAGLAWYCRCRQKRYAQPWTGVWMALVFLGGLPGLVGYLFHRSWPPREPCPNCGHTVPRDREACSACGKEFPPPQRTGVEVFA